jgi:Tol biopolymer transport system component
MHANWTPDGARIVFNFTEAGALKLFWMPWDGSGGMEFFAQGSADLSPGSWTPDGSSFSFVENNPATGWDIWVLRMSDRKASPLIADSFMEGWPEFSRDGKWLAYASNLSGRFEVYVTPFPGPGRRIPISTGGGQAPMWAPNGRELYYWNLDTTKLMEVDVVTGSSFHAGPPRSLLDFPYDPSSPARNYDITPDGRRFLIPERVEFQPIEVNRLNLVQNWFEELKRLCPTGKK